MTQHFHRRFRYLQSSPGWPVLLNSVMADFDLPSSVVVLQCPNGSTVYVVGTSHYSLQSIQDVRRTIILKKPGVVLLELCDQRKALFQLSDEDILRETKTVTLAKMRSLIRRDGLLAGIAQFWYLKITAELTQKLGVSPGGEFRAGFEEAHKIGANVYLGDRPVGITFKRVLATLSLWNKLYFAFLLLGMLTDKTEITQDQLEQIRSQDMVQHLLQDLTNHYPNLIEVIQNERDKILTHGLMESANCAKEPYGPAVTVVGVMGMAHVDGVCSNWMRVGDIRHLLTTPRPSRTSALVWAGLKISFRLGLFTLSVSSAYLIGRRLYTFLV